MGTTIAPRRLTIVTVEGGRQAFGMGKSDLRSNIRQGQPGGCQQPRGMAQS